MRLLHPLRILHIPRERILVAAVTISDGHKIEVVRVQGDDFKTNEVESARIAAKLIDVLREHYEIIVSDGEQQEWFKVCGTPEKWRTV